MSASIVALFVQKDGCYADLDDVDPWDEARDARTYAGDRPVIAHPPCHRWGKMARVNYARWGGEHNRPGNDGGCFASALQSVERCGGVLEHPASTYAWPEFGLDRPTKGAWTPSRRGWVCVVWQSAYGHRANKATWLYYVGRMPPFDLDWARPRAECQIGFPDQRGRAANKPTLSKHEANATPLLFREALLCLVKHSQSEPSEPSEPPES